MCIYRSYENVRHTHHVYAITHHTYVKYVNKIRRFFYTPDKLKVYALKISILWIKNKDHRNCSAWSVYVLLFNIIINFVQNDFCVWSSACYDYLLNKYYNTMPNNGKTLISPVFLWRHTKTNGYTNEGGGTNRTIDLLIHICEQSLITMTMQFHKGMVEI